MWDVNFIVTGLRKFYKNNVAQILYTVSILYLIYEAKSLQAFLRKLHRLRIMKFSTLVVSM